MHYVLFDSFLAFAPPVSDCSELYRLGYQLPGVYSIDPSGSRNISIAVEVYCQDGWTYLLRRGLDINVSFYFFPPGDVIGIRNETCHVTLYIR
jgi:hypothetical protein